MDLRRFYHEILKDDALADMSVSYINDDYFMSKIAEKLKPAERHLIERLEKVRPLSGFYEITLHSNEYFYLIKNRILLPGGHDSGFIHVDVVQRLSRLIKIRDAENEYLKKEEGPAAEEHYNALKLRITLRDTHTPIWREVAVPARLNFYELHLVIQKAMGWQNSHLASFNDEGHRIFVHTFDMEEAYAGEGQVKDLLASETPIDPILLKAGAVNYIYDYGDNWDHRIEVLEKLHEENPQLPAVLKHKGPGPIEDSGGVGGFEMVLDIIKNDSHPEHEEMFLWAKSQNYKARYPKKAINRTLGKLFSRTEPITESNDPSMDE
ncbi:plasmid pRiA4b ORF-3 family protein [Salinicoccus sp. HZC-1]|uniref:plasmid pRiA4b ORF-3 family protein n=1 Tax=Salinicoccus sp. HZC-1 TaxID=3385497 RepID=UPI00398A5D57